MSVLNAIWHFINLPFGQPARWDIWWERSQIWWKRQELGNGDGKG